MYHMGPNLGLVWASHNITVLFIYKGVHGQSKCFFQQTASSAIHSFKELELISTLAHFNSCWIFALLCSAFFLSLSRFPFHAFKRPFISFLGKEIASNLLWIASAPPGQHIFASTVTIRYKHETKKWYFVNIIVLTYCEKNLFQYNFQFFQGNEAKKSESRKGFANSRPKAKNL